MKENDAAVQWLLGGDNPAVRYRTLTELLDVPAGDARAVLAKKDAMCWLPQAADTAWMTTDQGLRLRYNLLALAECGLTNLDIDLSAALARLQTAPFDSACGDALLLRALAALGCIDEPIVQGWLSGFAQSMLPDGGFLCLHRLGSMKYMPKSCIKANMHALLMLAELKRHGFEAFYAGSLLSYFLRRRVFYRSDKPAALVLNCMQGKRMTDNFFPAEVMRVGLPQLMYAIAVLGAGRAPELDSAWELLESKRDDCGRYMLEGTMPYSYLPKERVGRSGKWVTLYALLAQKYK